MGREKSSSCRVFPKEMIRPLAIRLVLSLNYFRDRKESGSLNVQRCGISLHLGDSPVCPAVMSVLDKHQLVTSLFDVSF